MSRAVHGLHQIAGILWACRVSVLSLGLGWLVLTQIPQAQDLFLDISSTASGRSRWIAFYLVVFGFWMLKSSVARRQRLHRPHRVTT